VHTSFADIIEREMRTNKKRSREEEGVERREGHRQREREREERVRVREKANQNPSFSMSLSTTASLCQLVIICFFTRFSQLN
jgi:hypothetical protein